MTIENNKKIGIKLGIMQPYFFPYIGYWQLINAVDKFVIYDDVNYIKGGWINRNRINMNGKPTYLTLKLVSASPNKKIMQTEIATDEVYRNKMIKTIENAYARAPYFQDVFPMIKEIILSNETNLAVYLQNSIMKVMEYMGIDTEILISSKIKKNDSLRRENKVYELCRILNANEYYNAIGGKSLYSFDEFSRQGIKLHFLKTLPIVYETTPKNFSENLSILDVLMYNSKASIKKLLTQYELEGKIDSE